MKPVKLGLLSLSNSRNPMLSTRIAMLPLLRSANFESRFSVDLPSSLLESKEFLPAFFQALLELDRLCPKIKT